ncbi:MAG: hypothetical protein HY781_05275 [Chloroflexi bacterium]|nr:hypothetical protein [Chloroflexota bacterium]
MPKIIIPDVIGFDEKDKQIVLETYNTYLAAVGDLWKLSPPEKVIIRLLNSRIVFALFVLSSASIFVPTLSVLVILTLFSILWPVMWFVMIITVAGLIWLVNEEWKISLASTVISFGKIKIGMNRNNLKSSDQLPVNICHEMAHAHISRLRLQKFFWDEGIATFTEMYFFPECNAYSPAILEPSLKKTVFIPFVRYDLKAAQAEYEKSYWIIRYLFETNHDLLLETISQRRYGKGYDRFLARKLHIKGDLRERLEEMAYSYFVPEKLL